MKVNDDELVLSTGKRVYMCGGTIGLYVGDEEGDGDRLLYGADGGFSTAFLTDPDEHPDTLSFAECIEVADYMIVAWAAYRDAVKAKLGAE